MLFFCIKFLKVIVSTGIVFVSVNEFFILAYVIFEHPEVSLLNGISSSEKPFLSDMA